MKLFLRFFDCSTVQVFDKDVGSEDDFLGQSTVTIDDVLRLGQGRREVEFVLDAVQGKKRGRSTLTLGFDARERGSYRPPGKPALGVGEAKKELGANNELLCRVAVLGARYLRNADGLLGKSDPFVELRWRHAKVGVTAVVKNDLNPTWVEEYFTVALGGAADLDRLAEEGAVLEVREQALKS